MPSYPLSCTIVSMNKIRCPWPKSEAMIAYHDKEWGVPVYDDRKHFEFLILESAQAGLSWAVVFGKRDGYRRAFAGFDPAVVADYDAARVEELMKDPGIVRNRKKIEATIRNARAFIKIQREWGSFSDYLWSFTGGMPVVGGWSLLKDIPAKTPLSERISADMKKRGFSFLGPVVVYSHLQATGIVNDHLTSCFRFAEIVGGYGVDGPVPP